MNTIPGKKGGSDVGTTRGHLRGGNRISSIWLGEAKKKVRKKRNI